MTLRESQRSWRPLSVSDPLIELIRPWKLFTLSIGFGWLLWGALTLDISDWDIGVSVLMALFSYLTAPFTVRVCFERRWSSLPEACFWTWFTVDGVYVVYHVTVGNVMIREGQWPASLCLYLLCGFIWMHQGPLREVYLWRR